MDNMEIYELNLNEIPNFQLCVAADDIITDLLMQKKLTQREYNILQEVIYRLEFYSNA